MSAHQSFTAGRDDKLDDVESVYAFKGTAYDSDEKDEVVSVYAFDYEKIETEDSVYALEGLNRESSEASSDTDGGFLRLEEVVPTPIREAASADTSELLSLFCLTLTSTLLALICRFCDRVEASYCFVGPALLFACCFVYNYVDALRMDAYKIDIGRKHDAFLQWVKSRKSYIDTTEADNDAASVHTYDALDDDDAFEDDSDLTHAEAEIDTTEDNEAIDAAENASESDEIIEGDSPFGFTILNRGDDDVCGYEGKDYWITFVDESITEFLTKTTGELLILVFKGKDLKVVEHCGEEYTSFAELPTKVADLLVLARVALANL
uniref:DUF5880 domain-containing protein n=1 Tax=Panagrellus redivivus TaxID=6233 RepID=A0A7E4V4I6_PANRE